MQARKPKVPVLLFDQLKGAFCSSLLLVGGMSNPTVIKCLPNKILCLFPMRSHLRTLFLDGDSQVLLTFELSSSFSVLLVGLDLFFFGGFFSGTGENIEGTAPSLSLTHTREVRSMSSSRKCAEHRVE